MYNQSLCGVSFNNCFVTSFGTRLVANGEAVVSTSSEHFEKGLGQTAIAAFGQKANVLMTKSHAASTPKSGHVQCN